MGTYTEEGMDWDGIRVDLQVYAAGTVRYGCSTNWRDYEDKNKLVTNSGEYLLIARGEFDCDCRGEEMRGGELRYFSPFCFSFLSNFSRDFYLYDTGLPVQAHLLEWRNSRYFKFI